MVYFNWILVKPCSQGNFYILQQYSIESTRWDVTNFGTAWGDILYDP